MKLKLEEMDGMLREAKVEESKVKGLEKETDSFSTPFGRGLLQTISQPTIWHTVIGVQR